MNLRFELNVAFRYLRSRHKGKVVSLIAWLALVGVILGVASIIAVMSVMGGFRDVFTSKILGLNGHVVITSPYGKMQRHNEVIAAFSKNEDVVHMMPVIEEQALLTANERSIGVLVKGLNRKDLISRPLLAESIIMGEVAGFEGLGVIGIGYGLANQLGVTIGDEIKLISTSSLSTAIGTLPRIKVFEVGVIFNTGMHEYDNSMALLPLEAAQLIYKYGDAVKGVEVVLDDPHEAYNVAVRMYRTLEGFFNVTDWQRINANLFHALKVERIAMVVILTIIIIVAVFNIVSSLSMMVSDRVKDIAIMRTMGCSRASIIRIFMICGSFLGVIGATSGVILGVLLAENIQTIKRAIESLTDSQLFNPVIYFLSELPSKTTFSDVLLAFSIGIFFSFVATIIPAIVASRYDPAKAIRDD